MIPRGFPVKQEAQKRGKLNQILRAKLQVVVYTLLVFLEFAEAAFSQYICSLLTISFVENLRRPTWGSNP